MNPDVVGGVTPYIPYPKGNPVRITTFIYAYHSHYIETMLYVTGLISFINKTPIHWFINRHNNVDTSTCVSELVSMIISTELSIKMHCKLIIIVFPIYVPEHMIGDNNIVV